MQTSAILITLLSGLSFVIGYLIAVFVKNQKKLVIFSLGFSFIIILGLIFFDLLPECLELSTNKYIIILFSIIGIGILKLLDIFVPDHHHHANDTNHMQHIGLISALALFLHNIIEGTAIYTTSLTSINLGIMMAIGVSFHNIPLGIQITSLVKSKSKRIGLITGLSFSSIFGIIVIKSLKITLNNSILCILISITLGMLIYISLFELLCEIKENIKKKELLIGIISGVILVVISQLL